MAPGEAQGGSGGVGGCGGNLGRSFIEQAGRGGWVILGTQLGCALLGSVLSGKLFTPPSKVRREEIENDVGLLVIASRQFITHTVVEHQLLHQQRRRKLGRILGERAKGCASSSDC